MAVPRQDLIRMHEDACTSAAVLDIHTHCDIKELLLYACTMKALHKKTRYLLKAHTSIRSTASLGLSKQLSAVASLLCMNLRHNGLYILQHSQVEMSIINLAYGPFTTTPCPHLLTHAN